MTTTYFITGSIFLVLTLVVGFVKWRSGINKKFKEAERDASDAIDDHDTDKLYDALRRMRKNR